MHLRARLAPLFLIAACGGSDDLPGPALDGFVRQDVTSTVDLHLVPFDANAEDLLGPDDHNAMYGKLPEIVSSVRTNGLDVALTSYADPAKPRAFVLRYDGTDARTLTAAYEVPTLGRLLGFVSAPDGGFYYATGSNDDTVTPEYPAKGVHRANVVRVYRADAAGKITFDVDLDVARAMVDPEAAPLIHPGVASSARLALAGNQLALVHGINTAYDPNVMARHQMAMSTYLDATTGAITRTAGIWVSHSFDQRYLADGDDLYELHLGDAYPREVVVSRIRGGAAADGVSLYHPKGATGDNNTYTRLGGIARTSGGYLAVFATEHGDVTGERVNSARDLALVRTVADFASGDPAAALDPSFGTTFDVTSAGATVTNRVAWLTGYDAVDASTHAERPKLVPVDGGFVVLWERWTMGAAQTFDGTFALRLDATGAVVAPATRVSDSHLPRGDDAFADRGQACWLTGAAATGVVTEHCVSSALALSETALP
ncbi:MAG: hypothetical protein K8W52_01725 [Deltaproteobacteria bacterium]|nr:hypothetical protein [Deltaproteobacteria bacterium]